MEKTLSGLQKIDLDYATIYDLDVDNILVENLSCVNASFTNLSSINSCFNNISFNNTLNNVNKQTFNYISNLTSDAQNQLNHINSCLLNVSTNYWITNASVYYDNVCLHSVSTNYWITNSSFYNLSNLVTTINNEVNTINYNIGNTFTCFQLNAMNWATIGSLPNCDDCLILQHNSSWQNGITSKILECKKAKWSK